MKIMDDKKDVMKLCFWCAVDRGLEWPWQNAIGKQKYGHCEGCGKLLACATLELRSGKVVVCAPDAKEGSES